MAVMDEFKEERATLKNATFKEKLSYFWDYYKWHVIITVCAVAFIGSLVHQMVTAKDSAFYAVLLNTSPMTTEDTYSQEFAEYAEIDTKEYNIFFDTSLYYNEGLMDEMSYTTTQKLMVYTAAGDLDTMITDEESFRKYAHSEAFFDMRDILTPEQLEKYADRLYYVDWAVVEEINEAASNLDDFEPEYPAPTNPEEMEDPIPVGLYLTDCEGLRENFYFRGDEVVMGAYVNTSHLDNVLKFIDFVLEE